MIGYKHAPIWPIMLLFLALVAAGASVVSLLTSDSGLAVLLVVSWTCIVGCGSAVLWAEWDDRYHARACVDAFRAHVELLRTNPRTETAQ